MGSRPHWQDFNAMMLVELVPHVRPLSAAPLRMSQTMFVWNALSEIQTPASMMRMQLVTDVRPLCVVPLMM